MAARVGLSKTSIVEVAAALADEVGLDALALAALATRLHVRTPSLFHYVAGLAGLRREIALLGLREQAVALGEAVMGRAGDEAVRALAAAYRAYVKARPGVYEATVHAAPASDTELQAAQSQVVDIALRALGAYHLAPDDAIHAVRMLRSAVHGFATLEIAGGFGLPQEVDETFRRLIEGYLGTLAANRRDE
ncbi:MAG: TetR-like C-terminal domain-containing protein [Ktedonobacterales bacterium]